MARPSQTDGALHEYRKEILGCSHTLTAFIVFSAIRVPYPPVMHRVTLLRLAPSSSALHQRARRLSERTAQRPASVAFAPRAPTSLPATSPFASTAPAMNAATAAQKPAFTAVVKGLPETGELRDCPYSHRVLLTLEAKASALSAWLLLLYFAPAAPV